MAFMAIGALDCQSPDATAASTLSRRASSIRSRSGSIRSRQIASYFPDAQPSIVWRRTVAPSASSSSNQCSPCRPFGLTTRNARAAPGRSNSSQCISPASYKRCPCRRGTGAICVGQTRLKSAMSVAICSGGAATIRSWWFLIFIRASPHCWCTRFGISRPRDAGALPGRQRRPACAGGHLGASSPPQDRRPAWNRLVSQDDPNLGSPPWPSSGLPEEAEDGGGVEVEHLRAGELPVPHRVQAQRFHVEPLTARSQAALVPEHDNLLAGRRDDPRVHAPFVPGWLQGVPDLVEAGAVAGLQGGGGPVDGSAVGQGRRPVELDLGVVELSETAFVTLLDCGERRHHDVGACWPGHVISSLVWAARPWRGHRASGRTGGQVAEVIGRGRAPGGSASRARASRG